MLGDPEIDVTQVGTLLHSFRPDCTAPAFASRSVAMCRNTLDRDAKHG